MDKATMSVKELAKYLGISLPKAYDLIDHPSFPRVKFGRRLIIPADAVKKWLEESARERISIET